MKYTGPKTDNEGHANYAYVLWLEARLRKSEALIEQLRALLDGYEAMEKSMKQEASG